MTRRIERTRVAPIACAVIAIALAGGSIARAAPRFNPAHADQQVADLRHDGMDAFCRHPSFPLSSHAAQYCEEARSIPNCQGFVDACGLTEEKKPEPPSRWGAKLLMALGAIARWLVYLAIAAVLGVVVWLAIAAILRAKRDRAATEAPESIRSATPIATAPIDVVQTSHDAEALLRRAEAHAANGENDRAALLYLAASLHALDRRGAIRLTRDRTNGEYVRACGDASAKPALRAIVREVDRVQFGGATPTPEAIAEVAARATTLVRAAAGAAMVLMMAIAIGGCNAHPPSRASDPAGDDLFMALLEKQGLDAKRLPSSLATLPLPKSDEIAPVVVVDVERVPLEDETRAHLATWVEAGGILLLAGDPGDWPETFGAKRDASVQTDVMLAIPMETGDDDDDANADDVATFRARLAHGGAIAWRGAYVIGATSDDKTWAARKQVKRGVVLGIATDDLFTNAGLSRAPNASALMGLLAPWQGRAIRVARLEDGVAPPSNPLSALVRAGLGLALVHAAIAGILLIVAYGVRLSRARPTPPPARRAWTEHVEATGGLYQRAAVSAHALSAYARFVDGRLRKRTPRGGDPAQILALRAGADPGRCAALWSRATAARSDDVPRGDELAILRELSALYAAATKAE